VLVLPRPEEECVVRMALSVDGDIARPVPTEGEGHVRQRVLDLKVCVIRSLASAMSRRVAAPRT
jgi:hypothetical protein